MNKREFFYYVFWPGLTFACIVTVFAALASRVVDTLLPQDTSITQDVGEPDEAHIIPEQEAVKNITQEQAPEEPLPEEDPPESVSRYAGISMTEQERRELAAAVYLEAGNQPAEGQQAVAEVVLNRVLSPDFPGTVLEVLHQCEGTALQQFSVAGSLQKTDPPAEAYEAVDDALSGENVLPADVVYFSTKGENDNVWGQIGSHVFCYGYGWKEEIRKGE